MILNSHAHPFYLHKRVKSYPMKFNTPQIIPGKPSQNGVHGSSLRQLSPDIVLETNEDSIPSGHETAGNDEVEVQEAAQYLEEEGESESDNEIQSSTGNTSQNIWYTGIHDKFISTSNNQRKVNRLWNNLLKTLKEDPEFVNMSTVFRSAVDSNMCSNRFELLKRDFMEESDRVYAQIDCENSQYRMPWYHEMRQITINDGLFTITYMISSGSSTSGATITRMSSSGRITREYLGTSRPLKVIDEGKVVVERPTTRSSRVITLPTPTRRSDAIPLPVKTSQGRPNNIEHYGAILELVSSVYDEVMEETRTAMRDVKEASIGTTEERAEKRRKIVEGIEQKFTDIEIRDKMIEILKEQEKSVEEREKREQRKDRKDNRRKEIEEIEEIEEKK
ncbi:hypothetical protein F4703DRAFT_1931334 [Phycomyces blakesleeanus]